MGKSMTDKTSRKEIATLKETLEKGDLFVRKSVEFSNYNPDFLEQFAKSNNALSEAIEIIEKQNKFLK